MNMTKLYLVAAIENVLLMAMWTALAIHFEKWWNALFAILCFTTVKLSDNDDPANAK